MLLLKRGLKKKTFSGPKIEIIFKKLLTVAGIVMVIKADFVDVHHFLRGKRKRHKGESVLP